MSTTYTLFFFPFTDPSPTDIYTLSLHDALPICRQLRVQVLDVVPLVIKRHDHRHHGTNVHWTDPLARINPDRIRPRSEEHTSELQSRFDLVCRLLLEKKKKKQSNNSIQLKKIK